jgi:hypothetical protein
MNFFVATVLALLPRRYRRFFTPHEIPATGGILSGLLEGIFSLGLLIHGYYGYVDARIAALPTEAMTQLAEKGGESAVMGVGSIFLLEYLTRLVSIALIFFTLEGLFRCIAGIGNDEALPSLPLQLVAWMHDQLDAQNSERRLGERIVDDVQPQASRDTLQISSCRPKAWSELTTISYEGDFYQLVRESRAAAPRPFIYILQRKPVTGVIRGISPYDPAEVLQHQES